MPWAPSPSRTLWNAVLPGTGTRGQKYNRPHGQGVATPDAGQSPPSGCGYALTRGEGPAVPGGAERLPRPPEPALRAHPGTACPRLLLPSLLLKAFNKDFIFPPARAARCSLYNLLGGGTGEQRCPAPGRRGSLDPGRGGGRLGTACLRASLGMPAPARRCQSPPHRLPVRWEPLKPGGLSPRPSCERRYSAFVIRAARAGWAGAGHPRASASRSRDPREAGRCPGHGCSHAPSHTVTHARRCPG